MPNIVLYKIEKANSFKMIHECEIDCNPEYPSYPSRLANVISIYISATSSEATLVSPKNICPKVSHTVYYDRIENCRGIRRKMYATPEKPKWITKGLKEVLFIKSDIRTELRRWINQRYEAGYEWKQEHLIELIIDTFLDEDARTKVEPYANIAASVSSQVVNENEDEYVYDVEDEDIKKGNISSFTSRCAQNGCALLRRCKNPDQSLYDDVEYVYKRIKKIDRLTPK